MGLLAQELQTAALAIVMVTIVVLLVRFGAEVAAQLAAMAQWMEASSVIPQAVRAARLAQHQAEHLALSHVQPAALGIPA